MKRAMLVILSLILVLSLGIAPAAASPTDSIRVQKVLKPEKGSDIVLDKVELTKDGDKVGVSIKGQVTKQEGAKAFYIDVDVDKGTYKTTKAISQEANQLYTASTVARWAWVKIQTEDPVNYQLCASRLILDWWDYGSTIGYRGADLRKWAANPSPAGTHWYLLWSELYNPYITSTLIHQYGEAAYENWDFMNQNLNTVVEHYLSLEAHTSGTVYYTADWGVSGEYSWLLHKHAFVDTGVY